MLFQYGMPTYNLNTVAGILIWIVLFIIGLIIITIFLKLALGLTDKARNNEFGAVFVTSLLIVLCLNLLSMFLGLIGLIIAVFIAFAIISSRHKISYLMAILVAIVALILYVIVMIIIGVIIIAAIIALF